MMFSHFNGLFGDIFNWYITHHVHVLCVIHSFYKPFTYVLLQILFFHCYIFCFCFFSSLFLSVVLFNLGLSYNLPSDVQWFGFLFILKNEQQKKNWWLPLGSLGGHRPSCWEIPQRLILEILLSIFTTEHLDFWMVVVCCQIF